MSDQQASQQSPAPESDAVGAGIDFTDPNSPLAPCYLRSSHVVLSALLAAIFVIMGLVKLWHTDVWAHAKFGELMVHEGRLPQHEVFCDLADQSAPYVNFQWLSQGLFYLTYRLGTWLAGGDELHQLAGGVETLRIMLAALTVLRLAFLAAAVWRLTGSGPLACLSVPLAGGLGLANIGVLRPQVVAEVFLPLLLLSLSGSAVPLRRLLFIPLLMVIWANTHGSYPVGFMVLGACLAPALLAAYFSAPLRSDALRLLGATLLALAAVALLNPHGPWLFWHTLALAGHPNIADMDEWKRISFGSPWGIGFGSSLGLLALTMALRLLVALRGPPMTTAAHPQPSMSHSPIVLAAASNWTLQIPPAHWLLILGFGVQTYLHQRMMPWWVLLVPWILAPHWTVILQGAPWLVQDRSVPSLRKSIVAVLIAGALLAWSAPANWLLEGSPRPLERAVAEGTPWRIAEELRTAEGKYLPELAAWLREHYPGGRFTDRIFTSETQGDYLLWALAPETRLFMYTHVHLFPPEVWQDCQKVKFGHPDWEKILSIRDVKIVLVEAELHPRLRQQLQGAFDRWRILLDETGNPRKPDPRSRLLIAVRKDQPAQ